MTAMPPEPQHARPSRLTPAQRRWLWLAVVFAVADLVAGLWLSLSNLTQAAALHGWHPPWLLAVMIDLGVPTYVIVDHLLVILGCRSLLPRLAAWSFAGITVALNGAVSSDTATLWRVVHMLAPAAWVLGIETLRLLWRALRKGPGATRDRAPFSGWLADLPRTVRLTRRRLARGLGWAAVCKLEDARLLVADLAAARTDTGQPVPAAITRTVTTGWLPADLATAVTTGPAENWEPLVTGWAARQMALPATLLAAVTEAIGKGTGKGASKGTAGGGSKGSSKGASNPGSKDGGGGAGKGDSKPPLPASDAELAAWVADRLGRVPTPSANRIMIATKEHFATQAGSHRAGRIRDMLDPATRTRTAREG
jgi:uncharacterized membrane protein YgcG